MSVVVCVSVSFEEEREMMTREEMAERTRDRKREKGKERRKERKKMLQGGY